MKQAAFCWTCWAPPAGPGTPFHGVLLVPDTLRIAVMVLAFVSAVLVVVSIRVLENFAQQMRFGCLILFSFLVSSIEVEHLGDTANWRLGLVVLTLIWQTLSVGAFLRDRRRAGRQADHVPLPEGF